MEVFISWSGERSRSMSVGLYDWLRMIIQRVEPWMSDRDIEVGQRWTTELANKIKQAKFAILCVTPENSKAPWLHFEAGALAEVIGSSRVVPLLLDMPKAELAFPLAQFQAVEADREGSFQLVRSMNRALPENQLQTDVLSNAFNMGWPSLSETIQRCTASGPEQSVPAGPTDRKLLEEVLSSVRSIENAVHGSKQNQLKKVERTQESWEEFYVRGVNWANMRGGKIPDTSALQAMSSAIALFPNHLHKNTLARLYTYRAAMFKRLKRLDEARNDLELASKWAQQDREINDMLYNQACVAAMMGKRQEALSYLIKLKARDRDFHLVVSGGLQYFENLATHREFVELMRTGSEQ